MLLLDKIFHIRSMEVNENKASVIGVLNADNVIFSAHFPGHPVLPGVCQIRIVTEVLEVMLDRKLSLTEARNLKYINIITPASSPLDIFFSKIDKTDNAINCTVTIRSGEEVCTKMSLRYE